MLRCGLSAAIRLLHFLTLQSRPIDAPEVVNVAGAPYDKMTALTNVQHLAQIDGGNAAIMTATPGSGPAFAPGPPVGPVNLQTIALP